MAAPLEKTGTTGVFRRGTRYAIIYRDAQGKQRQESARTYDDARRLLKKRQGEVLAGTHHPATRERFEEYAREWIGRYQGKGRRGFRDRTRDDYRRDLEGYVLPQLGRLRLEQITPREVATFVAWLCNDRAQGERASERKATLPGASEAAVTVKPVHLADATVRRILTVLRACLASAVAEGLIRHNPARDAALPARDEQHRIDLGTDLVEEAQAKALTDEQLAMFLAVCPERWRPFFSLLAATGLRWSEAIALRWADVELDGSSAHVHVRRACVRGKMGPPKSKYGRRQIPIDHDLVRTLRAVRKLSEWPGEDDPVFPGHTGGPLGYDNTRRRALVPIGQEAGVPWVGFHTFRHTCATRLFTGGRNAVQVQRWLGHHSPAFTLSVYVHLLDGDVGAPLPSTVRVSAKVPADPTDTDGHPDPVELAEAA